MRFRSILLVLLSGNVLVTAANLLRDVSLASAFGAGRESDILFLAISIPLFLITVAANAFRSVTVPALGKAMAVSISMCQDFSRRLLLVSGTGTLLVVVLLGIGSLGLYWIDIPSIDPGSRKLFALFLAAILPMYMGAALLELWQGPLQAWGKFLTPSLLRLGLPCGIAAGALILPRLSIFSVTIGGGIATLLAFTGGLILLGKLGIIPLLRTPSLPPDVSRATASNFGALVLSTCITYANPLVDQWLAGLTGEGGISMLGYANRLTTGIAGLVAGALSQALLVHYSRQVSANDHASIQDTYRRLLCVTPWLGCFATIGIWLASDFGVFLLYQRGSFGAETSAQVATLIDLYALQYPIYWTGVAAFTLIWAASMNRIFLRIGIVLFVVNIICDLILIELFGLNGIPLTTSVVYGLSVILLNLALRKAGLIRLTASELWALLTPFLLLAASWLAIRSFDLRLSPGESWPTIIAALLLLLGFGAVGAAISYRALTKCDRDSQR